MRNPICSMMAVLTLLLGLAFASCVKETEPETECADATDNDLDGLYDCDDPDCAGLADCPGAEDDDTGDDDTGDDDAEDDDTSDDDASDDDTGDDDSASAGDDDSAA